MNRVKSIKDVFEEAEEIIWDVEHSIPGLHFALDGYFHLKNAASHLLIGLVDADINVQKIEFQDAIKQCHQAKFGAIYSGAQHCRDLLIQFAGDYRDLIDRYDGITEYNNAKTALDTFAADLEKEEKSRPSSGTTNVEPYLNSFKRLSAAVVKMEDSRPKYRREMENQRQKEEEELINEKRINEEKFWKKIATLSGILIALCSLATLIWRFRA